MLAFRALGGLGGGVPVGVSRRPRDVLLHLAKHQSLQIGAAVIGDLFEAKQRGRAVAIYNLAPLPGPALGPIIGAVVTQYANRQVDGQCACLAV